MTAIIPSSMPRLVGIATVVVLAATAVPSAGAGPPQGGLLVPGRSLGGVRLGATDASVRARWGSFYGQCHTCRAKTWYFTYTAFQPQGVGVVFRHHRAIALFTIWSPQGWRVAGRNLYLGFTARSVRPIYGRLPRTRCRGYTALVLRGRNATTELYLANGKVWGFGLSRPGVPVCH
jgi:hypothetical protein